MLSDRLQWALTQLVVFHRGYGELAMAFPFVVADLPDGEYAKTNGEVVVIARAADALPVRQYLWLIGHELAHILLGHTMHMDCADPARLMVAREIEADQNVPDVFDPVSKDRSYLAIDLRVRGIDTLERIYAWLGENRREEERLDSLEEGSDSDATRSRVLAAMSGAGDLPGSLQLAVDRLRTPTVPWEQELAHYIGSKLGQPEYRHGRLVPHYWSMGFPVPPVDHRRSVDMVLAVDSSGSMAGEPIRLCLSQIRGLRGLVDDLEVYIADAAVQDVVHLSEVTDAEIVRLTRRVKGYGGTDFRPVFEALAPAPPQLLVYLTDADGTYPEAPAYDVLWVTTTERVPPFGRTLRIPVFNLKEV